MKSEFIVAIGQLHMNVGDPWLNAQAIVQHTEEALKKNAHLIVFPELTLGGYAAEDLFLRQDYLAQVQASLHYLQALKLPIDLVVGFPEQTVDGCYNAATVLRDGKRIATYYKQHLPNYGIFDEKRYFHEGDTPVLFECQGLRIGLSICEDLWENNQLVSTLKAQGASLLLSLNASPFHKEKAAQRRQLIQTHARSHQLPIIYAHWSGGQDDFVFDGGSFAVNHQGHCIEQMAFFQSDLKTISWSTLSSNTPPSLDKPLPHPNALTYQALVTATHDYIRKTKAKGAIIGLSGGIDSALTLAIAVDALGAEAVTAVMMPSSFTSEMSLEDAQKQAQQLGVEYHVLSIHALYQAFLTELAPLFENKPFDTMEENLQARCRGVLLMAISNATGKLLLSTGNKSELAVGYATLYGDMCGGFSVLKDIDKTRVYQLARYRNSISQVIPDRVIERAPSAELAPNQTDQDTLPPYETLDVILEQFIEQDAPPASNETTHMVIDRILKNEHKRYQSAIGPRISHRAFSRERRYPICHQFDPFAKQQQKNEP